MRKCNAIKNRSQLEARHTKRIESKIKMWVNPEDFKYACGHIMRGSILQWWENLHDFINQRITNSTK